MKGSYRIVVQNAAVRFDFEIKRNITIIKGDSATGKTTLVEMIREHYENGESSGIELSCKKSCAVISGKEWAVILSTMKDKIVFIDEGNAFVHSKEFARAVQQSDNYYVIVTREGLANLPYSVDEIYGIRESGKYGTLKKTYNEMYHIYGNSEYGKNTMTAKLIVEDSNAGFEFYESLSDRKGWSVKSANGKSNIFAEILNNLQTEKILVIADGAAFGAEMDRIMKLLHNQDNIMLYLPESFEWLILKSGILNDKEIRMILENPQDYIE